MFSRIWDLHLKGSLPEARGAAEGLQLPLRCLLQQALGSLEGEAGRQSQSLFFFFFFSFFSFFIFLGWHLQHMEVPRLGVKSEL